MSVDESLARLNTASVAAGLAMVAETEARAEWVRASLIDLAEKHPVITGFSFETDWEYDDEGGYFPTTSIYADLAEPSLETEYALEDELTELQHSVTHEVAELIGGQTTVQQLKEVTF